MVSRPSWSVGKRQQAFKYFWFIALLAQSVAGTAVAQSDSNAVPFSLSSFFGSSSGASVTDRRTRISIELRSHSKFEVFSLSNPNRVVVEMPQLGMRLPSLSQNNSNGLVKNLRAGQFAPGRSRIVIDVTEPVIVEEAKITANRSGSGAQLDIVLAPFKSTENSATKVSFNRPTYSLGGPVTLQPPIPRRARDGVANKAYKPLIVIDPGHGGKDSGAQKFGVNEKDVVLAFGQTLAKRLEASGRYRVKMTRDSDVFISLERRREIAEDSSAALFIAVHADYAGSNARGATIYSLRRHVANRLREAAATEAARDAMSGGVMKYTSAKSNDLDAVRGILGDLAQREVHVNLERTNVFTQLAIAQMGATTTMRSRPHQEAAFKVLKTAKVPSVLIELAYVSNRRDAARLQSQDWRDEVSASLVTAIEKYFSHSLSQIAQ